MKDGFYSPDEMKAEGLEPLEVESHESLFINLASSEFTGTLVRRGNENRTDFYRQQDASLFLIPSVRGQRLPAYILDRAETLAAAMLLGTNPST